MGVLVLGTVVGLVDAVEGVKEVVDGAVDGTTVVGAEVVFGGGAIVVVAGTVVLGAVVVGVVVVGVDVVEGAHVVVGA